jgi:hypothetical protein
MNRLLALLIAALFVTSTAIAKEGDSVASDAKKLAKESLSKEDREIKAKELRAAKEEKLKAAKDAKEEREKSGKSKKESKELDDKDAQYRDSKKGKGENSRGKSEEAKEKTSKAKEERELNKEDQVRDKTDQAKERVKEAKGTRETKKPRADASIGRGAEAATAAGASAGKSLGNLTAGPRDVDKNGNRLTDQQMRMKECSSLGKGRNQEEFRAFMSGCLQN